MVAHSWLSFQMPGGTRSLAKRLAHGLGGPRRRGSAQDGKLLLDRGQLRLVVAAHLHLPGAGALDCRDGRADCRVRGQAAVGQEAHPGSAEEGRGTERTPGQQREQRHGKDALGEVEDGAHAVADCGVYPMATAKRAVPVAVTHSDSTMKATTTRPSPAMVGHPIRLSGRCMNAAYLAYRFRTRPTLYSQASQPRSLCHQEGIGSLVAGSVCMGKGRGNSPEGSVAKI